jgi:hypothetical protein
MELAQNLMMVGNTEHLKSAELDKNYDRHTLRTSLQIGFVILKRTKFADKKHSIELTISN